MKHWRLAEHPAVRRHHVTAVITTTSRSSSSSSSRLLCGGRPSVTDTSASSFTGRKLGTTSWSWEFRCSCWWVLPRYHCRQQHRHQFPFHPHPPVLYSKITASAEQSYQSRTTRHKIAWRWPTQKLYKCNINIRALTITYSTLQMSRDQCNPSVHFSRAINTASARILVLHTLLLGPSFSLKILSNAGGHFAKCCGLRRVNWAVCSSVSLLKPGVVLIVSQIKTARSLYRNVSCVNVNQRKPDWPVTKRDI